MYLSLKTLEPMVSVVSLLSFLWKVCIEFHMKFTNFWFWCLVCVSLELLSDEQLHCDSMWFFTWNMCFKNGRGMYFCYWSIHGSSCIWNFTHFYRLLLFSFLINCVCCGYSVMINHTGTGCEYIVSIFPYENWIFSCEILQGASIFSNEIVFNKTYPKCTHLKYLLLTPSSLF